MSTVSVYPWQGTTFFSGPDNRPNGRLAPGEGNLPLGKLMKCLPEKIPVSLAARSKYYREGYPDPVERAKVILERTREAAGNHWFLTRPFGCACTWSDPHV